MIIKDIDLFKSNEFTKPQRVKIKSFKEIYKQYKNLNWDEYKNGFDSIHDYFKKVIDDTPEIRQQLISWVKSHKSELGYKGWK